MTEAMTHWERFRALMAGQPVDRLPRVEWAIWWDRTFERWQAEGLPVTEYNPLAIWKYWNLDAYVAIGGGLYRGGPGPVQHGAGVMKDEDGYGTLQHYLYPAITEEELAGWAHCNRRQKEGELLVWLSVEGFFWFPRTMFGIENHLYAFYDQPDLMHRINRDATEYYIRVLLPRLADVCKPAYVHILEDMSYNHGPMLSKALFDEFLAPYYRQLIAAIKGLLGSTVIVDSDGQGEDMVPWLRDVGVDGILPLERQAGVDGLRIRKAHPEFAMIGHFDKMTLPRGEQAMRDAFERLLPLIRSGRFIPSVDHQTPPGVSMDDYRIDRRRLDEYTEGSLVSQASGAVLE